MNKGLLGKQKRLQADKMLLGLCCSFFSLAVLASSAQAARAPVVRLIIMPSQSEADSVLAELGRGTLFPLVAKERSLDEKSRDRYGELDAEAIANLGQILKDVIAGLGEGEVSGVIQIEGNRFALVQMVDLSHYRKGAAAFRAKDFKTAETNLQNHIEANPDAVKARVMLGQIYENRKAFDKAEGTYLDALRFDPANEKAYLLLGALYLRAQRPEQAKGLYEEGLRRLPASESLKAGLVKAGKRIAQGKAVAGKKEEPVAAETGAPAPTVIEPLGDNVVKDLSNVDAPDSKTKAPKVRTKEKPAPEMKALKSAFLREPSRDAASTDKTAEKKVRLRIIVTGSEADAAAVLSEMTKGRTFAVLAKERSLDESSRNSYGYLGEVQAASLHQRIQEALKDLKEGQTSGILKLEEDKYVLVQLSNFSLYEEGEKAFATGDFTTAEAKLRAYVGLNPDAVKARTMIGKICEDKKEFGEAIDMYRTAISFDPEVALLYERLARVYLFLGQYQRAKDVYVDGLRRLPSAAVFEEGIEMADILMIGKGARLP
jgi:tetratricopeptide (TPR) repeat protein